MARKFILQNLMKLAQGYWSESFNKFMGTQN